MIHKLDNGTTMEIDGNWIPAIPLPYFTTKGLPFWKRFSEKNWRLECACDRIFDNLEDYNAHMVFMNSPYRKLHGYA